MDTPDFGRLAEIGQELGEILEAGGLTFEEFSKLWSAAKQAVNGHDEFLEFLENIAEPGWIERLP